MVSEQIESYCSTLHRTVSYSNTIVVCNQIHFGQLQIYSPNTSVFDGNETKSFSTTAETSEVLYRTHSY